MNYPELLKAGFVYDVEHWRAGELLSVERVHNLMPIEALNHVLSVLLAGGTQVANWYIGLYEGNYTPVNADVMSTFPTLATECTTYDETTRQLFQGGPISAGTVNNFLNKASFTSNANKTIYGGFISSVSSKGATSGVLLSAVKFASPKTFSQGDELRATAGFTLASL